MLMSGEEVRRYERHIQALEREVARLRLSLSIKKTDSEIKEEVVELYALGWSSRRIAERFSLSLAEARKLIARVCPR